MSLCVGFYLLNDILKFYLCKVTKRVYQPDMGYLSITQQPINEIIGLKQMQTFVAKLECGLCLIGNLFILKCFFLLRNFSVQKQPDTKPTHEPDTNTSAVRPYLARDLKKNRPQADIAKLAEPDTPHNSVYSFVCLYKIFEGFWPSYPQATGNKNITVPDENLFLLIITTFKNQWEITHSKRSQLLHTCKVNWICDPLQL